MVESALLISEMIHDTIEHVTSVMWGASKMKKAFGEPFLLRFGELCDGVEKGGINLSKKVLVYTYAPLFRGLSCPRTHAPYRSLCSLGPLGSLT